MRSVLLALAMSGCAGEEDPPPPPPPPPPIDLPEWDRTVTPPAQAAPTGEVAWSCPDGWRAVGGACDPFKEDGAELCPEGEAHFVGASGCTPIGTPCDGRFAEPPEAYRDWFRVYYDPAAPPGGDGLSAATATTSFRAARRAARDHSDNVVLHVAMGETTIQPTTPLPPHTLLWGACASGTLIRTATGAPTNTFSLAVVEGWTGVGNMTWDLAGPAVVGPFPDLPMEAPPEMMVDGLVIRGVRSRAVEVLEGGRLSGRRLLLTDITPVGEFDASLVASGGAIDLAELVSYDMGAGVFGFNNSSIRLTDARVASGLFNGVATVEDTSVELIRTVVEDLVGRGVAVDTGDARLEDVLVRRTSFRDRDAPGFGLAAIEGGSVVAERLWLDQNTRIGAVAFGDGSMLDLTDAVISRTNPVEILDANGQDLDEGGGYGLSADESAAVLLTRTGIEQNVNIGMLVSDLATVTAEDLSVTDTGTGLSETGEGIVVLRTGQVDLTRTTVSGTHGRAVSIAARGIMVARDLVVTSNRGAGLGVNLAGQAIVERGHFEENQLVGINVEDANSTATLNDVTVVRTRPRETDDLFGVGVGLQQGGAMVAERLLVVENERSGITVSTGADFSGTDVQIERTRPVQRAPVLQGFAGLFGRGLNVEVDASASLTRALLQDNTELGVFTSSRSMVTLTDVAILRTLARPKDDLAGRGLHVQGDSTAVLAGLFVDDNREAGVLAVDGSVVEGSDVTVLRTRNNDCFLAGACDSVGGHGLLTATGGRIELSDFLVSANAFTGVTVGPNSEMDLSGGEVSHHEIGANVLEPSFDTERIAQGVVYQENQTKVTGRPITLPTVF